MIIGTLWHRFPFIPQEQYHQRELILGLDSYHFNDIKTENSLYWIWHSIIVGCINESRKVMLSNKVTCSFSHEGNIKLIGTVISITTLKWVHDWVIIYLVMINLAYCWESSMEFRHCRANLSNSDIGGKKAIESCVNAFQAVIVERGNKVCHLKAS